MILYGSRSRSYNYYSRIAVPFRTEFIKDVGLCQLQCAIPLHYSPLVT